jgi:hypothetical protein
MVMADPVEFALARILSRRIELVDVVAVQRPQAADARQYRRASALGHQDQRLGQLGGVLGSISEGDERRPKTGRLEANVAGC